MITFSCLCGEWREREMDREEMRRHKEEHGFAPRKPSENIHRVVHDFYRRFKEDEKWRWSGWEMMRRVEKWAKKYPGDVRIVGCDDGYFSSSALVLIEGRAPNAYMGTTVVYIPQCTGEPPTELFLYPNHRNRLVEALREIAREALPRTKRQREMEVKRDRWWASRPVPEPMPKEKR